MTDCFLWFLEHDQNQQQQRATAVEDVIPTQATLMELVSASSLGTNELDPYCVVYLNKEEVHRTKSIRNDPDPIWTIRTNSICLLHVPLLESTHDYHYRDENDNDNDDNNKDNDTHCVLKIEVNSGSQCLGLVTINIADILNKTGEREEYVIRTRTTIDDSADDIHTKAVLALRFRQALPEDIRFFEEAQAQLPTKNDLKTVSNNHASDINFRSVMMKSSMVSYEKIDQQDNRKRFRIQPYPNPDDVENTTWMTKEQVHAAAVGPSKNWVEAGYGDMGTVHVEVIGCDDLVNMDLGVNEKSDAFVAMVLEDAMVRTNIIHDSQSPRWMPWSTRAFAFRVCHPTSILMVGVFDYDHLPLKDHDPIGRLVIHPLNFKNNTTYNLQYKLHDDPLQQDDRGTIWLRLRVEWASESKVARTSFAPPPRFLINVESEKSLDMVRYVCNGKVNMDLPSMESVQFYAKELMSYGPLLCYVMDVGLNVLLWRGRAELTIPLLRRTVNIWFPVHSIALFIAAVICIEVPMKIPAITLFAVAWTLLTVNKNNSMHPNPWMRCQPFSETILILLTGKSRRAPVYIYENDGVEEAAALEALDKVKAERVQSFFVDAMKVGLQVRRIFQKTQLEGINIHTEDKNWSLMGSQLYYLHLMLQMLCTYLRMGRNFVNWRDYSTHKCTLICLICGTMWLVLPLDYALLWALRVGVWACLGPWVKLVDMFYIHPYYRTKEELLIDPTCRVTCLDQILTSKPFQRMGASARLAQEEAVKLKDMREHRFGKLAQLIPAWGTSRFPNTPLPHSTAEPVGESESEGGVTTEARRWRYVKGQKLGGHMVHQHFVMGEKSAKHAVQDDAIVQFDGE